MRLPSFSEKKLIEVTKLTGGMALLVGIAVLLSNSSFSQGSQAASAVLAAGMTSYNGYPMPVVCTDGINGITQYYGAMYGANWNAIKNYPNCLDSNSGWPGHYHHLSGIAYQNAPLSILSAHAPGVTTGGKSVLQLLNYSFTHSFLSGAISTALSFANTTVGASTYTVAPGQAVQLEWSCVPSQEVHWAYCTTVIFGACLDANPPADSFSLPLVQSESLTGGGVNESDQFIGSTILYPMVTTTYTLSCPATLKDYKTGGTFSCPSGYMYTGHRSGVYRLCTKDVTSTSFTLTVNVGTPALPTASLYLDGNVSSATITAGQSIGIHLRNVVVGSEDSLQGTAINGTPNVTVSVPGGNGSPLTSRDYTFSTTTPGDYPFAAAIVTNAYNWNNYGSEVTVHVACPSGTQKNGSSCEECAHVYDGACVASCPVGTYTYGNQCYDSCQAQGLYTYGQACVISCPSGYTSDGAGVCQQTVQASISTLQANPSRVRKGSTATLTWTGNNLPAQCALSSTPAITGLLPTVTSGVTGGSAAAIGPINQETVFTLVCQSSNVQNATVSIVPTFQEI